MTYARRATLTRKYTSAALSIRSPSIQHQMRRQKSAFQRTTSVPAATFTAVANSTAKGARNITHAANSTAKGARNMTIRANQFTSRAGTGLRRVVIPNPPILQLRRKDTQCPFTPFIATLSRCTSTRGVVPAGIDEYYFSAHKFFTPCASTMAVNCGIGDDEYFPPMMATPAGSTAVGVAAAKAQGQAWWVVLLECCAPGADHQVVRGDDEQENPASVWLAAFQVLAIIVLSVSLYRNVGALYT